MRRPSAMRTGNSGNSGGSTAVIGGSSVFTEPEVHGSSYAFSTTTTTGGGGTSIDLSELIATLNGYDVSTAFQTCNGTCVGYPESVGGQCQSRSTGSLMMAAAASQLQQHTSPGTALTHASETMTSESRCHGDESCASMVTPGHTSPTRKSSNMTERVVVPSSEHVAEIVGRQGCKIKALRNKTNTYIKTPVRGEDPVFVVTGRREDVDAARREIISAAEHFSHIRATRTAVGSSRQSSGISGDESPEYQLLDSGSNQSAPPVGVTGRRRTPSPVIGDGGSRHRGHGQHAVASAVAGQVTIGVRVPISMVGLVVGPKGATVKRIQQDTGTYIVTPGRQKDPVFEVIGTPAGVEKARRQIESYLETRIGPSSSSPTSSSSSSLSSSMAAPAGHHSSSSLATGSVRNRDRDREGGQVGAADILDGYRSYDEDDVVRGGVVSSFRPRAYADITKQMVQQQQQQQCPHQFVDSQSSFYSDWNSHSDKVPFYFRQDIRQVGSSSSLSADHVEASSAAAAAEAAVMTMTSHNDQPNADGLLSWFNKMMLHNNNVINGIDDSKKSETDSSLQQYQHHQQSVPYNRNHIASDGLWSTPGDYSLTAAMQSTVRHFDDGDDNPVCGGFDVEPAVDLDPLSSSWNYIFTAAGLSPRDVDGRYGRQLNCSRVKENADGQSTRESFWSPIKNEFDQFVGRKFAASDDSQATRLMFCGSRFASGVAATQSIRIGGTTNGKCAGYSSRGVVGGSAGSNFIGGGAEIIGNGGSEETSPLSMSPVESFSAGSSSG